MFQSNPLELAFLLFQLAAMVLVAIAVGTAAIKAVRSHENTVAKNNELRRNAQLKKPVRRTPAYR